MLKSLKQTLKKNDFLNVVYHAYKDKNFRSYCSDFYQNSRLFRFEHLGTENPGRNIYFIREGSSSQGMFSIVTWTLRRLEVADRFSFTPVVVWDPDSPVNARNSDNPFLLYFAPVSDITSESAKNSTDVAFARKYDRAYGNPAERYDFNQEEINRLSKIYSKYIKLLPAIEQSIKSDYVNMLGNKNGKVLGVHVRGVDWRKTQIEGHPIALTEKDYLKSAREMMTAGGYDRLFLATDSESTISMFKEAFGNKLAMFEAARTPVGSSSLAIFNADNDPFQMSYEVLRDAYALAWSDALLCGVSYVSYVARIIKLSLDKQYEDVRVLDKGTVKGGVSLQEAEKEQRKNAN